MSIRLMSAVFELNLETSEKFVLLVLCDFANDEGLSVYPSQNTIARKTSLSRRTVTYAVKSLAEKGYIEVIGKRDKGQNEYKIFSDMVCATTAHSATIAQDMRNHCAWGSATIAQNPSVYPSVNLKSANALSGEPERIPVVYESGEYIEVTESKSIKGSPDQKAMVGALARHLKIDLAIRANGARLGRAAKQLLEAQYTTENIETFIDWWKLNDWRWKKDRRLPSPEEVLANIGNLDLKEDREEQAQHDALRKIIEEDMRNRNV